MTVLTWNELWRVFGFAWLYRKPIGMVITDAARIKSLGNLLIAATDATIAQEIVKEMLNLRSVNEIVLATETQWDDRQLALLKEFVADQDIFTAAWKVLHGDWSFRVAPDRRERFLNRIRQILPFASPDTNWMELSTEQLEDKNAEGVIEVIALVNLLVQIMPKILEIIKKYKK